MQLCATHELRGVPLRYGDQFMLRAVGAAAVENSSEGAADAACSGWCVHAEQSGRVVLRRLSRRSSWEGAKLSAIKLRGLQQMCRAEDERAGLQQRCA